MRDILLQKIITHAFNTVPYYKRVFAETGIYPGDIHSPVELDLLPLLEKSCIQASPEDFCSSSYLRFPESQNIIIQRTSGSTGTMLKIHWTNQDMIRSLFHLWTLRGKYYGITPASKFCSFHTSVYRFNKLAAPEETMLLDSGRCLSFSKIRLDDEVLEKYYCKMLEFEPEWLFLQPGTALLLTKFIAGRGLKPPSSLRYIELTGEYLFDETRKAVRETFKVPVANMYGCNEANGIALECPQGNLHCLENNVVVEILKQGKPVVGEDGEVIITSLANTAMPFIRYALGDRGSIHTAQECACGNKSPVLKVSAGRLGEKVRLDEKRVADPFIFAYAVENINKKLGSCIMQFQVVQQDFGDFTVNLVPVKHYSGWKDTISKEFANNMEKLGIENAEWKFCFHERILPDIITGKLRFFINNMKERECSHD